MPFFDLPSPGEVTPESRVALDEYARLRKAEAPARTWHVALDLAGLHEGTAGPEQLQGLRLNLAGRHFVVGER